jgi:hypothetical protein
MTIGYLGPCGINLPHTHPRATEINFSVDGDLIVGFYQENGAEFIMNEVHKNQVAVFPKGAIHFEQNLNCVPATFVAALPNVESVVVYKCFVLILFFKEIINRKKNSYHITRLYYRRKKKVLNVKKK